MEKQLNRYWKGRRNPPTCVDLFCGAGGLSLGFCQAGGIPIAAVDCDEDSMATYRAMFPVCNETYAGSIESWKPRIEAGEVSVVIGGPPCQGFSLARGLRFVDDPRNRLYKQFVRMVVQMRPDWFVMENVPGIISIGEGVVLRQIYEDFDKVGYALDHRVINMAEYGVPQSRKRTIFVGHRGGKKFQWPSPTHVALDDCQQTSQLKLFARKLSPYLSIRDALSDLPLPLGKYFAHRANSQMRGPRNRSVDVDPAFTLRVRGDEFAFCSRPATGAFIPGSTPPEPVGYRDLPSNPYQEMMREAAPPWVKNYGPLPILANYKEVVLRGSRRLTVREQARLQSFPDWFRFFGRAYSQGRQIGNAVPPFFARQLFSAILHQSKVLESESGKTKVSNHSELLLNAM